METETTRAVTAEVRACMGRAGVSTRGLAEHLDVSPMWVSRRLSGRTAIAVNDLARIASALGVKPSEIYESAERHSGEALGGVSA